MPKSLRHSIALVLLLALALVAGWRMGQLFEHPMEEDLADDLIVSISLQTKDAGIPLELSITNEAGEVAVHEFPITYQENNVMSFALAKYKLVKGLSLRIKSGAPTSLYGIELAAGKFVYSYDAQAMFDMHTAENCTVKKESNWLRLTPIENANQYQIAFPETVTIHPPAFAYSWAIFTFLLVLVVGGLIYFKRQAPLTRWSKAFAIAVAIAGCISWMLTLLVEEVKNIEVDIVTSSTQQVGESAQLYYSMNGTFQATKILTMALDSSDRGLTTFKLPDGMHRHLRLDLPVEDVLILHRLEIRSWLSTKTLSGRAILDYFPLLNDLETRIDEAGDLVLHTGNVDPYLQLSNATLQNAITRGHMKKADYPIWMALVLFLILLALYTSSIDKRQLGFATGFVLILMIPGITFLVKQDQLTLNTEKRLAFQAPIDTIALENLPRKTSLYLDDQFGGRTGLITSWNILKVLTYNQTNQSSPVLMGSDGWMYYKAEGVQETFENKTPISEATLHKIYEVLEERRAWLALYGIDYYVVFPPIKHGIYEEHLPPRIRRRNDVTKLDQALDYMAAHSTLPIIDLRETLMEAKAKESTPIYYRRDSHWNLLGGFYGYRELMQRIAQDYPQIGPLSNREDYNWLPDENTDGDLVQLLSLNEFLPRSEIVPVPHAGYRSKEVPSLHYPTYVSIHEPITRTVNNPNLPKLVMNRDSYSNYLIPYLGEHFQRSVYLWTPLFSPEIIKQEKPDIVITEMLERYLLDLTIENPPIMRQELEAAKRAQLKSNAEVVSSER